MIGIYRIKNIVNGKCYYGSSKNIEKRWQRHKNDLKNNKHNPLLQRAWNKYGGENFLFEIVEECDETILLKTEQKYLELHPEYNIGINAGGGDNLTKNPKRDDIIKKITETLKNRCNLMTKEEKKEKFSHPMEENPNWKGGSSYVYCKCGKRIGWGHIYCNKCIPRSDKDNPFYGKKHTDEYKLNASLRQKGQYNGDQNKFIIIDDVEYRSAGDASKKLGIPMVTIRWRVLSKNKKFENYKYK